MLTEESHESTTADSLCSIASVMLYVWARNSALSAGAFRLTAVSL
jgi:hypothetical protein